MFELLTYNCVPGLRNKIDGNTRQKIISICSDFLSVDQKLRRADIYSKGFVMKITIELARQKESLAKMKGVYISK